MIRVVAALALVVAGCSKKEPAPATETRPAIVPAAELQRGRDACTAYVTKLCACADAKPELADRCKLARALPEALEIDRDVGNSPDIERKDAVSLAAAIRKTIKECIEQTAKLPALGCP